MQRSSLVMAAAAVLLASTVAGSPLSAQRNKTTYMGISAGASLPSGDLANTASSGYNVAGHLYFNPSKTSRIGTRFDLGYDNWSPKNNADATLRSLAVVANVIAKSGNNTSTYRPYVIGGVGIFKTKVEFRGAGGIALDESSDVGGQLGAGVDIPLAGFTTFIEARYVMVSRSPSSWSYIPVTVGLHF
jgi:hypothetical protein